MDTIFELKKNIIKSRLNETKYEAELIDGNGLITLLKLLNHLMLYILVLVKIILFLEG